MHVLLVPNDEQHQITHEYLMLSGLYENGAKSVFWTLTLLVKLLTVLELFKVYFVICVVLTNSKMESCGSLGVGIGRLTRTNISQFP